MRYVIAYDIALDARRAQVAAVLEGWGDRVQYSVFEVDLAARELEAVLGALEPLIIPPADRLRVWRLCGACQQATHAIGGAAVADRDVAWIV
jgi:CRISPR-associated protein Cas2